MANGIISAMEIDCFQKKLISTDNVFEERAEVSSDIFPVHCVITPPLEVFFKWKSIWWEVGVSGISKIPNIRKVGRRVGGG